MMSEPPRLPFAELTGPDGLMTLSCHWVVGRKHVALA